MLVVKGRDRFTGMTVPARYASAASINCPLSVLAFVA